MFSLTGLFGLSFINQLFLPAPTDLVVLALAKLGNNLVLLILITITGQVLGSCLEFIIAKFGIRKIVWINKKQKGQRFKSANKFYRKYGKFSLLFSSIPFIGNLFPLIAGLADLSFIQFFALYVIGKAVYYLAFYELFVIFLK